MAIFPSSLRPHLWLPSAAGLVVASWLAFGGAASQRGGYLLGLPPAATATMVLVLGVALAFLVRRSAAAAAGMALLPFVILQLLGISLPGIWALSGPPLLALVLGVVVAILGERAPRVPRLLFWVVILSLYVAVAYRVQRDVGPQGDEPHYLMVAESILEDGDLSLESDYAEGRYRAFFDRGVLEPHYRVRGKNGEIFSLHAVGLSLLLLPAYALGGYPAASFFMALLAAFLAREVRELVRTLFDAPRLAEGVAWVVALSPPLLHFSGLVFTEVAAALFLAMALRKALSDGAWRVLPAFCAGSLLAFCPWLNVRYVVPAGLVLLAGLVVRRGSLGSRLALVAPSLVSGLGLMAFHQALYGFLDPRRVYGRRPELSIGGLSEGLPGLLLDQEFGLLIYAPVFVLAIPGILRLARFRWRVAVLVAVTSLSVILLIATWPMWRGGFNPPARFLVPIVPFLALGLAAALRGGVSAPAAVLIGWGLFAGLTGAADPRLVHRDRDETAPLWREASGAVCWTRLLPGYVLSDPDRNRLALLWGSVLVVAVVAGRRPGASAWGLGTTGAVLALAAGIASAISQRTGEGRESTRLLGRTALSVPGWSVRQVDEVAWTTTDLRFGPTFEPHRHPDGAPLARRLRLSPGRYRLTLSARRLSKLPPTLRVEFDSPPRPVRLVPFVPRPDALSAEFEVGSTDGGVSLGLQGGGAIIIHAVALAFISPAGSTFGSGSGPTR